MQNLTDKKPSKTEEMILKVVWDGPEEVSMLDLAEELRRKYQRDYARTTIVTFLGRLAAKGFVTTYRRGRLSYVRAIRSEEEYLKGYFSDMLNGWFGGDKIKAFQFMIDKEILTLDDKAQVLEIINNMYVNE